MNDILAEVSSPTLEDDLIVLNKEEYYSFVVFGVWKATHCQGDCGRITN